jgi:hypothetical protein
MAVELTHLSPVANVIGGFIFLGIIVVAAIFVYKNS